MDFSCVTFALCASRRSFGPRARHWHVYAPRRLRRGRHTKGDHPHVVRLRARHPRWRRLHDGSSNRHGGRASPPKGGDQATHGTAWAVGVAGGHADREPHERGLECVWCFFIHLVARLTWALAHPSRRLQTYPASDSLRAQRRPPLQSGGPSRPRHRARLEHPREPRTHGRNYVRGVPGACILHCKHWRVKRVRPNLPLLFGAACDLREKLSPFLL